MVLSLSDTVFEIKVQSPLSFDETSAGGICLSKEVYGPGSEKASRIVFPSVIKISVPFISSFPKPIANQTSDGPVNVSVVVKVSPSIVILAVNP